MMVNHCSRLGVGITMRQEPQERVGHFPSAMMFFCLRPT